MRKRWYVIQTLTGMEDSVKENIEKKVVLSKASNIVGRVVVPEEVVIDASKKSMEKHVLSPDAKVYVKSGQEVNKGDLLAEEPAVRVRRSGKIVEVKNYRRITVETIDRKYHKIYHIPESAKVETGIKVGARVRQGMPFTKDEEYFSELDGRIVNV